MLRVFSSAVSGGLLPLHSRGTASNTRKYPHARPHFMSIACTVADKLQHFLAVWLLLVGYP